MKKIVSILVLLIAMTAIGIWVKKTYFTTKINCNDEITTLLNNDPNTWNNSDIAIILKNCGKSVCDLKKYDLIIGMHEITDTTKYGNMISSFWENKTPIYTPIDYQTIDHLGKGLCYNKFLTFNYNESKMNVDDIIPVTIDNYTDDEPCYSFSLFRGLYEKYKDANGKLTLYFTKAHKPNSKVVTILFYVLDPKSGNNMTSNYFYFDMTQNPTFTKSLLESIKK